VPPGPTQSVRCVVQHAGPRPRRASVTGACPLEAFTASGAFPGRLPDVGSAVDVVASSLPPPDADRRWLRLRPRLRRHSAPPTEWPSAAAEAWHSGARAAAVVCAPLSGRRVAVPVVPGRPAVRATKVRAR
jgi:hypothetical protein